MTTNLSNVLVLTVFLFAAVRHAKLVDGANVLAVSTVGGKSHWNFMRGILRALTDHGHRVTVFTPYPDGDRENYTEIEMSDGIDSLVKLDMDYVERTMIHSGDLIDFVHDYSRDSCKMLYEHDDFRRITNDPRASFDVAFIEIMSSECVSYMSARLNGVPLVYTTPPPLISYMEHAFLGHYPNPAVVSHTLADHSVPRTFMERFTNALLHLYTSSLLKYRMWSVPGKDLQPFDLVEPVKPSIVFSNAHYITDASRPLPPSVIPVGGIHLSPPKAIPNDILEFIENSPTGVIVFTLGSVISISSLPKNVLNAIIEVLGQVPHRVLMKYEDGGVTDLPKNIKTVKWFPQRDIILHPNVKLFISHGGISGIYEAVDAGIPVLGFPVMFDQLRNLAYLVDAGMAISLKLKSISKETFLKAITELINNDKYKKNAMIANERFKDRPMTPAQTVDYWTRYVIRHKGAPHLKSHALNLTWYQYLLLDVLAVLFIIVLLMLYIAYKCFKLVKKCISKFRLQKSKPKSQ